MDFVGDKIYKCGDSLSKIYKCGEVVWSANTTPDYSKEYLTLEFVTEGLMAWKQQENIFGEPGTAKTISYSKNGGEWIEITSSIENSPSISVSSGDIIRLKGINDTYVSYYTEYNEQFGIITGNKLEGLRGMSPSFNVYGNILSLIYGDNFRQYNSLPSGSVLNFYVFFAGDNCLSAENLVLPHNMTPGCYRGLFSYCKNLVKTPKLPSLNLVRECYKEMFRECTSLTTPPTLPATNLAPRCYSSMFFMAGLTTAPQLPATNLAESCYDGMFHSCAFSQAPVLPATALTDNCYQLMFTGCGNLVEAPQLPATSLTPSCYGYMFDSCISLMEAPELPATTLAPGCYLGMFRRCFSLTAAPELPATVMAENCYAEMFQLCSGLTAAPELPATTLSAGCYMNMFEECTSLSIGPAIMAPEIADYAFQEMFKNCTSLSYLKCLLKTNVYRAYLQATNWMEGVPENGTFVKDPSVRTRDLRYLVPSTWTIEEE